MEKEFIAHSENSAGIIQTMKEHSNGVAMFMRDYALTKSFRDLYEFCGIIHDLGKYSSAFQKHINGANNKVKHSIYGSIYAKELNMLEIALPIYGHHAGLPDTTEMLQNLKAEQIADKGLFNTICLAWKDDIGNSISKPDDKPFWEISDILQQELFVRHLFSSLVDADSLDTERHFYKEKFSTRKSPLFDVDKLLSCLQKRLRSLSDDPEKKKMVINKLRNEVRLYAESKAYLPQGCFSLTLPTGLGKTLCSINWALHHAQYHRNIKRIIVVLPFINIIEQTADTLKSIFNNDNYVLEHHSNVTYINDNNTKEGYELRLLATENWDYPIIITSSVQFFESLFSNKRSACRKLHNIQDAIIIFDEIQTLPMKITEPTLTMLDNLLKLCRCSILFCTATQPDFQTRKGFSGISHIESLVENPKHVFEITRRVTYHPIHNYNEIPISELADIVVKNGKSALVVFNTKKKARMFYDEIESCDDYKRFHLSTNMCPAHKKEVIKNILKSLKDKENIIVSSTQLIEAGVDMDFPTVYRELAPLESIIQSAGRCNREGNLRDEHGTLVKGDVYLFALTDSSQPSKQYRSWSEFANLLYKGNEERLYSHDFYSFYNRTLIENFGLTDELKITDDRKKLLYQTISDKYKIIENNTQPLFVYKYNEESRKLYDRIKNLDYLDRQDLQQVAQYSVQVYDTFIEDKHNPIGMEKFGVLTWFGDYNPNYGLPFKDEFNSVI